MEDEQDWPVEVTCAGGITLPPLSVLLTRKDEGLGEQPDDV